MKLARFAHDGQARLGLVVAGGVVDIARHCPDVPPAMTMLIERWDELKGSIETLSGRSADHRFGDITLLAPVERPGKIMAIGLNYADHIAESGLPAPTAQTWFAKMSSALNGPFAPVELPKASDQLDYEAELVAVIGTRCRHVSRAEASGVIFGYMAGNDFSVRDWQRKSTQFILGKSFDSHAPVGPWIVTSDTLDPHALGIRCLVNADVRQSSNTKHLLYDVFDQIEELSQAMTLEPGDLIFTGTPGGVAAAMDPPKWLVEGDVVRVEIDGIGAIENRVVREGAG